MTTDNPSEHRVRARLRAVDSIEAAYTFAFTFDEGRAACVSVSLPLALNSSVDYDDAENVLVLSEQQYRYVTDTLKRLFGYSSVALTREGEPNHVFDYTTRQKVSQDKRPDV